MNKEPIVTKGQPDTGYNINRIHLAKHPLRFLNYSPVVQQDHQLCTIIAASAALSGYYRCKSDLGSL